MKNIKYILIFAVLIVSGKLFAQQDPLYSMYRYNMSIINPAYAGASGDTELNMHTRSQWMDIDDAPETQSFVFTKPVGDRIGIGFSIVNDSYDITKETNNTVDFSYRLQLSENSNLYLGVKAGAYSLNVDFLSKGIGFDPEFDDNVSRVNGIFGAGAYLKSGNFYATLSIPNFLNGPRVEQTDSNGYTAATDLAHVYAGAGYTFDLGENYDLTPSFLSRFVEGAPTSVDITTMLGIYTVSYTHLTLPTICSV